MTTSSRSPLKQTDLLILTVLHEEPLHGYGIVKEIESMTDGRVRLRPGDVYRMLYRLDRQGLIESTDATDPEDERRSYYRITAEGRRVAEAEARLLSSVTERLLTAGRRG